MLVRARLTMGNDCETLFDCGEFPVEYMEIIDLKHVIASQTGIPVESQKLVYLGKILEPDESSFSKFYRPLGNDHSAMFLVAPKCPEASGFQCNVGTSGNTPVLKWQCWKNSTVTLSVKMLHKTVQFEMNTLNTVRDVFDRIESMEGLSRFMIDLVFRGTRLAQDHFCLVDYNITTPAATLHVVIRLWDIGCQNAAACIRRARRLTADFASLDPQIAFYNLKKEPHSILYALHHLVPYPLVQKGDNAKEKLVGRELATKPP